MPQRVVLHRPRVLDAGPMRWSVVPSDPLNPLFGYTLGVGVDWREGGVRRAGFVTVAHPFWKRGITQSFDVVRFSGVGSGGYFWLRTVRVLPPSGAVDASLHRLELLGNAAAPPVNPLIFPHATPADLAATEATFCPNSGLGVVAGGEFAGMEAAEVEVFFEPSGAGPWCRFTKAMPTIPAVDPLDASVSMGELTGLRDAVRAERIVIPLVRFDKGFSGQGWTVGGRFLGLQVGVADPHSALPGKYGYALAGHAAVTELNAALLTHPGYDAGTLRVVSVF